MLDMLRRFEQAQAEGDEALSELEREVDAEDELAAALKGVDLGKSAGRCRWQC